MLDVSTRNRSEDGHFGKGNQHAVDYRANNCICQKCASRSAMRNGFARTEKQTRAADVTKSGAGIWQSNEDAQCASESDHLHVPLFHVALCAVVQLGVNIQTDVISIAIADGDDINLRRRLDILATIIVLVLLRVVHDCEEGSRIAAVSSMMLAQSSLPGAAIYESI